ncbi:type IV secretory system conjugative DNA transfer family protein [Vibrio sp. WXL210]|uniref:type IV secretory system conjugative DNA transfer family protein n=1 Tax=Vibrio sp. WXL210 TaxID=3450709 RepID=UPI003EC52D40
MFDLSTRVMAPSKTFGSAHWMSRRDLSNTNLCENQGNPLLGGLASKHLFKKDYLPVYLNANTHSLTIAPTRSGKGTCHIIPNLLTMEKTSIFVLDLKSENHDITAQYREEHCNSKVYRFAPYDLSISDSWNPIKAIYVDPNHPERLSLEQEYAEHLTMMLLSEPDKNADSFWIITARHVLQAFIMYVAYNESFEGTTEECYPREQTMAEVVRLLGLKKEQMRSVIDMMRDHSNPKVAVYAAEIANLLEVDKAFSSVLAHINNDLSVWTDERVKSVTTEHNIDFATFREKLSTFYLMIDPEHIHRYKPVIRALVGWGIKSMRASYDESVHRDQLPVYFFLDEFLSLGRFEPVLNGMTYLAGYGIRIWMFIQNLGRLKGIYGSDWETFIANSGVKIFFGVADYDTACLVSQMMGQQTVQSIQRNYSATRGNSSSTSSSTNYSDNSSSSSRSEGRSSGYSQSETVGGSLSYVGRSLMTPDEVMRMQPEEAIALFQGQAPIKLHNIPYYKVPRLLERAQSWTNRLVKVEQEQEQDNE